MKLVKEESYFFCCRRPQPSADVTWSERVELTGALGLAQSGWQASSGMVTGTGTEAAAEIAAAGGVQTVAGEAAASAGQGAALQDWVTEAFVSEGLSTSWIL